MAPVPADEIGVMSLLARGRGRPSVPRLMV